MINASFNFTYILTEYAICHDYIIQQVEESFKKICSKCDKKYHASGANSSSYTILVSEEISLFQRR